MYWCIHATCLGILHCGRVLCRTCTRAITTTTSSKLTARCMGTGQGDSEEQFRRLQRSRGRLHHLSALRKQLMWCHWSGSN